MSGRSTVGTEGRRGSSHDARCRRSPGRGGTPSAIEGRAGSTGAEEREDLVDHRRLGEYLDDPLGPAARRAGERIDVEDLLQQRRPTTGGIGRPSLGAGTIAGVASASAGSV